MKLTARHITAAILISSFSGLYAQTIIGLDYNHAIKNELIEKKLHPELKLKSAGYTPPLPKGCLFFDDFSTYKISVFPDPNNWTDKYAFINQTYPDSCISIGVATLDAIDDNGDIYATDNKTTPSDTLTSRIVPLNTVKGKVYLSFFVEGGGKGTAPKLKDSLLVDFYDSDSSVWRMVWFTEGYESHNFKQIIIPIDSNYKDTLFRFRFRNYTTLLTTNPNTSESGIMNSGFWNIDYVQVKSATNTDDIKAINDVAIVEPLLSTYKEYYAFPYDHFEVANSYRRSTCPMSYRTYYPNETKAIKVSRQYSTWNIYKGQNDLQIELSSAQNDNAPMEWSAWDDYFRNDYIYYPDQKYGDYLIKAYITADNDTNQYKYNDTITREEVFKDYYALDDGTAEAGFGLPSGTSDGAIPLAYMFNIYTFRTQDTLTAIDYYFAHSKNNIQKNVEFLPCVWKANVISSDSIVPGECIYPVGDFDTMPRYTPDTNLAINEFMRIRLTEDLICPDTIFIGLIQYGTENINIGYDVNTDSRTRIRYVKDNKWYTPYSIDAGSLMIRPVFDHKVYSGIRDSRLVSKGQLTIYPNPANSFITMVPENFTGYYGNYQYSIVNILGQTVISGNILEDRIDISSLQAGMYIVRVIHVPTKSVYVQKFLKTE
jgi:hypothetical protein